MVLAGIRQGLLAQMPEALRDFDIVSVDLRRGGLRPPYGLGWSNLSVAISQAAQGTSPVFASVYRCSWGYRDLWNPLRAGGCQDFPARVKDIADLWARERLVTTVAPHTRGASQA